MCPVALVGEMDLIWAWVMYASKVYSQPSLGGCRDRDEKAGARADWRDLAAAAAASISDKLSQTY